MSRSGRTSPATPMLILFGIVVIAAIPPLGLICIVTAIAIQIGKRSQRKAAQRAYAAQAYERDRNARILAFKSLP